MPDIWYVAYYSACTRCGKAIAVMRSGDRIRYARHNSALDGSRCKGPYMAEETK